VKDVAYCDKVKDSIAKVEELRSELKLL